jgi:maltose 6'-phosphate phosphatase
MITGYTFSEAQVHFISNFPEASAVSLAADFTDWERSPIVLHKNSVGLWEASSPIPSVGLHAYKYIVDDVWQTDPSNPNQRRDNFGGMNSLLMVSPKTLALGGMNALRVVSLNLHTYQEAEPLHKLKQVAEVLMGLDVHVVALQEVGQHQLYPARQPNAGEFLKKRLDEMTGVEWFHEWRFAHVGFDVYDEGVSILSKIPLEGVETIALGGKTYARVAVSAGLSQRNLRVTSAHTSWPGDGAEEEFRVLCGALRDESQLLAGDFNTAPYESPIKLLQKERFQDVGALFGQSANTFLGGQGPGVARIDYHWLRGSSWRAVGFTPLFHGASIAGIAQPRVSDHVGLLGIYEPS